MKLSKHAKFWALGALGGVGLFALGVFAQQNGALDIDSTNQDLFSDLKAVFFLERKDNNEIDSIVRLNVSNGTVVSAPTSDLAGGEAKNTLQNNASIIGSTNSVNTSSGAFLIATNSGRVEGESMQSFVWGASNTTLKGYNAIAVATKNTNLEADNTLALAAKDSTVSAKDSVVLGGKNITINPAGQASLAVWSKINVLGASGALVFNGKTSSLQVDTASAHTMVVNADNGLIINTNNSNNQKIQLTVSGAIKLWEVNNAPAQASPYISVKTKGSVTCVCGRVSNQNSALSKYTRGNKQIADLCQKVCDDQNTTLTAQCGAAATNYPLTQTQWSTDDFCQWGLGHAGAKPTFPALGGQVSWTCESFPSGGPTCTATRKGCWDGIRAAGEQCDLGTNNGKPDSNCSASCENVKAPKCWANAKTYLGSDVAWAQPNGFCTDDSVLGEAIPAFWNGSTSGQKTWTCKNKNNKTLTCSANRLPPAVAGACGTALNTCSAGTLSGQTTIPHGDRWSCDGLYGGSNKTCSRCDSGYKYNTTTNICEIDCPNPIYRHTNGVTIKAADCAEAGKEYMFEGQKYYVARDKDDIQTKIAHNTYPANRIVTTRVTDMIQMFDHNPSFNQDIGNWDTSKVTTMYGMFYWAEAFNQPLNNWDTSKVTTMWSMFHFAQAFKQPLNNWDTSKVTDMWNMFHWAEAFNQPLNNWDTSKVTDMWNMFRFAQAFNQPLNNWDTSKVTDMWGMFASAQAFDQPLNNWDTSKVTNMMYMFEMAQAFDQPLNNRRISQIWDENLRNMFTNAPAFKANQPYCTWANWSAKKWNFVNMGLNACINGQCKAYPWNHASQPATTTANACVGGDYQDIADDAHNWKWKCNGKYWATSTECSAAKQPAAINAQCKAYPWNHTAQPATSTANGCVAGDYQDIADDTNNWKWKCIGKYSGTSTECSASKQPGQPSYTYEWYVQPYWLACQPKSITHPICISIDVENNEQMSKCIPSNPNHCPVGCKVVNSVTEQLKDARVICMKKDTTLTPWPQTPPHLLLGTKVDDSFCPASTKPMPYLFCWDNSSKQTPQKCYAEDRRTIPNNFELSHSHNNIATKRGDWGEDLNSFSTKAIPFLDATLSISNSYLYIPVTYHPIYSDSSINTIKGTLSLKWRVDKVKSTAWYTINKTIPLNTTLIRHWIARYIKLSTKDLVQLDPSIPCEMSNRKDDCTIVISEAKLTLDKVEVECSSTQPTCPSGFTASNGKCVKWKCENTPASTTPARCEKKSNYKYIETEGYRFIEWEVGRVSWQVACDTMEEQGYNPSDAFMLRVTCPLLWYWLYDSLSRNEWHFTWWFDTWNRKMSVKVPSGNIFGILNPNAYIEWDFLYDPTAMPDHLIQEYLNSQHTGNPYRGIVLNENQKDIHFCENLDFSKRHIPIFSAQTDYNGKRYPMCQENTDCTNKNQSQCNSLSKICKRITWTTTPASTKTICIDNQWNTITDSFCSNAWSKPSCTLSKINGQCKIHAWNHTSQPATATANGCVAGEYEDIPDDTTNWKWKCKGKNWGTETTCSAAKGSTNPLDRKPWTVRFIVNCPDYISSIQIEWISKTPNEGPRYDDYYIDLPLVNGNGEMPTPEYPWLKRWYPVLNKTFDNSIRKITIVRDNAAPGKWWAYQINLPSNLIPQNLPEGGRYDIPTMSCLRSGEA